MKSNMLKESEKEYQNLIISCTYSKTDSLLAADTTFLHILPYRLWIDPEVLAVNHSMVILFQP